MQKLITTKINFLLRNRFLPIFLIFVIAFFLRLYHLGYHEFWYDEVFTASAIFDIDITGFKQRPLFLHPFLFLRSFCRLIDGWIELFPVSEFSVRLPFMIFSSLSVILIFFIGKTLFDQKTGALSALIMALSPFHLWYAQEARDYSLILFFGLFSSLFLLKAINKKRPGFWLLFTLASVLGIYTNYFFIFLLIAQILYIIIFFKNFNLNLKDIIPFLIIGLFFLPISPLFLRAISHIRHGFWVPMPNLKSLVITLENFILGYNGNSFLYFTADILILIFFISAMINFKDKDLKPKISFCLLLFAVPVISAFIFSKLFFSIYLDRAFIIFSPYFYLILSLGLISLKRNLRIYALAGLLTVLFVSDIAYFKDWMPTPYIHHVGVCIKRPIKPLVMFIEGNFKRGDLLAFTNLCTMAEFKFYSKKKTPLYYFFDPLIPNPNSKKPEKENEIYIPYFKVGNFNFKRLWLIGSDWTKDGSLDENSIAVKRYMDKNLKSKFSKIIEGVRIFGYEHFDDTPS